LLPHRYKTKGAYGAPSNLEIVRYFGAIRMAVSIDAPQSAPTATET
jgi:hypothetical protein